MTETEAAWLAGFLDGEGSFMIMRADRDGFASWAGFVAASSTTDVLLMRCKELVGGVVTSGIIPGGNARQAGIWTIKGRALDRVLPRILPYLVGKKEQAEILLMLRSEITSGALPGQKGRQAQTSDTRIRRETMRLAMRALNHRGTTPIPPEHLEALMATRQLLSHRKALAGASPSLSA